VSSWLVSSGLYLVARIIDYWLVACCQFPADSTSASA